MNNVTVAITNHEENNNVDANGRRDYELRSWDPEVSLVLYYVIWLLFLCYLVYL